MSGRSAGLVPDRRLLAPAVLWVAGVLGGAWLFSALARGVPNAVIEDDAYFYLQIAWNVARGLGPTFDSLHLTNGFHLLWMGVLAPLAFVVQTLGGGKPAFLFVACGVSLAIAAVGTVVAFRGWAERALSMAIFIVCGVTMEGTLLGVLVLSVARAFLGELRLPAAATLVLAALIPLTRIDYAWIVPVLVGLQLSGAVEPPVQGTTRSAGLAWRPALAGTVVGMTTHLAVMRWGFGAWVSVSSAYKADLMVLGPAWFYRANLAYLGNVVRYVVVAGTITTVIALGARLRRDSRPTVLLALSVLVLSGLSLVTRLRDWYFVVPMLLTLLGASRLAGSTRPRVWQAAAAGHAALIGAALVGFVWLNAGDLRRTASFIREANARLAPRDLVYGVDGTGFAGWWLEARVIAGDGLVHSWEYRQRSVRNGLAGYLDEVGATHVLRNHRFSPTLVVAWRGLVVRAAEVVPVASTGPTRNRLVAYELFARRTPAGTAGRTGAAGAE